MIHIFRNSIRGLLSATLLFSTATITTAQEKEASVLSRYERYQSDHPADRVFLHTDRDVYAPSDELKFTGYFKNSTGQVPVGSRLVVLLMNPAGDPVGEGNYPIQGSRTAGSIKLPDTLGEGEYRLLAWAEYQGKKEFPEVYSRKIFIRGVPFQNLHISLKPDGGFYQPGDFARVSVHIGFHDTKPFNDDSYTFLASKNGVPFQQGSGKTDSKGNATQVIRIPGDDEEGLITLTVSAENKYLRGTASVPLLSAGIPVFLNFFPEGGTLVDGLRTRVGFRAEDYQGRALEIEGLIVDQDNQPVDSIRSDRLGFGSFQLLPDMTDPLKVRIIRPAGITREIPLPVVRQAGLQLILLSRKMGELTFHIRTNILHAGQRILAVAVNNGNLISQVPVILNDTISFAIPTAEKITGVLQVSLLSDRGTVLAQRSLFYPSSVPGIIVDSGSGNGKNQTISKINISLATPGGEPADAFLSGSVSDAIVDPGWNREPDIRSWFMLGPASRLLPPDYFSDADSMDANTLDNLMLSLIDTAFGWKEILTGEKPGPGFSVADFKEKVLEHFQPGPFEQFVAQYNKDQFFNRYYLNSTIDFRSFIRKNQLDLEEFGMIPAKPTAEDRVRERLDKGIPILSVLRSVKAYTLMGDVIFFRPNKSLMYPKGALFIIDEIPAGHSIEVLRDYSPYDIEGISVSLNSSEILKYDGEAEGLIKITTKKSNTVIRPNAYRPVRHYNPTLFWNPEIKVLAATPTTISLPRPELKSKWRITLQGVDAAGNFISFPPRDL